tara:strand:- start:39153 stop:39986 length:834 start_codon:yes stop_codon:yes gene_type:complete
MNRFLKLIIFFYNMQKLKRIIKDYGSVAVAFSGGVDSSLVLKVAYDVLGEDVVAITADSFSVSRLELDNSIKVAKKIGVKYFIIKTNEINDKNYVENNKSRCYYCKTELYGKIKQFLVKNKIKIDYILNGTNVDDLSDYRPGLKAAEDFGVKSPLVEAGLKKEDVRKFAKELGLEIWDKPASPCLASRIPYGSQVTVDKLRAIEGAEEYIKISFGINELRVRHFGDTARIDVKKEDFSTLNGSIKNIEKLFKGLGFEKVILDELKRGSLNKVIKVIS